MRARPFRKLAAIILSGLTGASAAAGCGGVDTSRVTAADVVPLDQAPLSDAAPARVVGIGEATHGNKEFVRTRLLVIQRLVRDHGFRTVAIEADFGGTAVAGDYVMGGEGSAEGAAKALGFDLYRTRETADLIKWIHDHNAAADDRDKIRLYGFDMQRYDRNKERLLRYLAKVDPALRREAETSLADLTDATRTTQDPKKTAAAATAAGRLVATMRAGRERYVKASSAQSYAPALHHAETIWRGARLQTSGNDYAAKRDAWMAGSIGWIAGTEAAQGRKKIIVAGHNGHIDKSGAAFPFQSMGQRLAKTYGGGYFAIGTEFGRSTFISKDEDSGARKRFTVSHDAPVAKLFGGEPMGYVNLAQASADPGNRELLTSKIRMGSVGDGFRSAYSSILWAYTVEMVPAKSYDALIYVPEASPVTPL
ncbi:erythromycin esterase family protein [Nonomuraea fuscirosea]|uniref:erythromycin esterase family protein n=1 Tax=Nonomuraea fuscirosea TaxID=1291556 RepID=UPI002DD8A534|nr:erythromycin esterase family protein [Nonomuraea fuscirosea]WSA56563.1 erythromycin esterase family protein [Nonomuraea fuscirosea]